MKRSRTPLHGNEERIKYFPFSCEMTCCCYFFAFSWRVKMLRRSSLSFAKKSIQKKGRGTNTSSSIPSKQIIGNGSKNRLCSRFLSVFSDSHHPPFYLSFFCHHYSPLRLLNLFRICCSHDLLLSDFSWGRKMAHLICMRVFSQSLYLSLRSQKENVITSLLLPLWKQGSAWHDMPSSTVSIDEIEARSILSLASDRFLMFIQERDDPFLSCNGLQSEHHPQTRLQDCL